MGSQQLLLLILVAIIVGLAVQTGLRMFDSYNQDGDRDRLTAHIPNLVSYFETYAAKTRALGGGRGSFTGCRVPQKLLRTPTGTFACTPFGNILIITATGSVKGRDNRTNTRITAIYFNRQMYSFVTN